jgi:membrane-associated protease RseP (regulator of RpoE activity)
MGDEFYIRPGPREAFGNSTPPGGEPPAVWGFRPLRRRWFNSPAFHGFLFFLTFVSTLIVGTHIALNYEHNFPAFDWDISRAFFASILHNPSMLKLGIPFSLTLLSILLAHEMGHYFTCRYYGIRASYPYFIPAPTLIGTMGAFIRIKTPITTRRALFDVGISGPLAGFIVALPALIVATLKCQAIVPINLPDTITLGNPLAITLLGKILRPGLNPASISLQPIGCAAWVGLFATALNLLPVGQLDGGHILYAVLGERHRTVSWGLFVALVPLGVFCWAGWMVWAVILLVVGLRHPVVMIPSEALGKVRQTLALLAVLLFLLTFVPTPFAVR